MMKLKTLFFAILCLLLSTVTVGQSTALKKVAVQDAEFPGGSAALTKYLKEHLVIPVDFQGDSAVRVRFTIDEFGNCKNIFVRNTIENCEACQDAVVALIEKMPQWKPAFSISEKKNVATIMVLTVPFVR